MNPNDYLAGVNLAIAFALLGFAILYTAFWLQNRPQSQIRRVFLIGLVVSNALMWLDYGTTGILRLMDVVALPDVPHSLLPDFTLFPVGVTVLIIVRTVMALLLWSLLLWVVVVKGGIDKDPV